MKLTTLLLAVLAMVAPLAGQPLVMPEYPGDLADAALATETGNGDLFRLFLAEALYVSAMARDDASYVPEAARALQKALVRYPDLIGWVNGGLAKAAREAKVESLVGDVATIQARVDSMVCHQMVTVGLLHVSRQSGIPPESLPLSRDLCASPGAQQAVLAVFDRVYRQSSAARREQLLKRVFKPELFEQAVIAINAFVQGRAGGLDLGNLVDAGRITAGMPAKYAELLNEMLPTYYSRFKDRHRLLIHYLMADPERRTAALFQASGPALQKVVQMVADYTNNPSVRSQLGELKSGVRAYGPHDIKLIIDEVLARSTRPEYRARLTVNYAAIGSGTIAQAHVVTLDKGQPTEETMIIKVKRPGLQEAVEREMAMFEEVEKSAFAQKLINDVRATLEREMNLGTEAVEIGKAQKVYRQGRVDVPPVVTEISASDSLVAISFVKGRTIDRVNAKLDEVTSALDPRKHTVNRSVARHYVANLLAAQAEALYELTQLWFREAVFESGFFHGDLHSGNVFLALDEEKTAFERRFTGHHRVTLIDFGNSGQFSRKQQQGVVEYAAGVARGRTGEVLDGLVKTGTIVRTDRAALTDTVSAILENPDLTFVEKSDWVATVCYAEGTGTARSLVSFLRARILLETQLADVNRRLDGVDPEYVYPRYTSDLAYREVVRSYVLWSGVKSLVGLGGKGNGVISFSEARALQRAAGRDVARAKAAGTYFAYPARAIYPRAELRIEGGLGWSTASGDAMNPSWRRGYDFGLGVRFSSDTKRYVQPAVGIRNRGYYRSEFGLEAENKLRYLSTSVVFGWRLSRGRIDLFAGPEVGILISAESEVDQAGGGDQSFDIEDNIRKDALSLLLGASLNGPVGVALHVTYNPTISDFSEMPGTFRSQAVTASISLPVARFGQTW